VGETGRNEELRVPEGPRSNPCGRSRLLLRPAPARTECGSHRVPRRRDGAPARGCWRWPRESRVATPRRTGTQRAYAAMLPAAGRTSWETATVSAGRSLHIHIHRHRHRHRHRHLHLRRLAGLFICIFKSSSGVFVVWSGLSSSSSSSSFGRAFRLYLHRFFRRESALVLRPASHWNLKPSRSSSSRAAWGA